MENNNQQSFWQFSDQLRLHSSNFANLSLNDSIWSVNSKKTQDRRNFDIRVGADLSKNTNVNANNDSWKLGFGSGYGSGINLNGGFNKGVYSNGAVNNNHNSMSSYNSSSNNNVNMGFKGQKNESFIKREEEQQQQQQQHGGMMLMGGKHGKKNKEVKRENYNYSSNSNSSNKNNNNNNNNDENGKSAGVDKRFKTLPASEALPRNETVGGYIFVCNNDTMEENLKRQLFGLPPRYRDSVRQITPGLPLFLYNYSTHQLHGIYEASSFGGTNIDPMAWEDKKNPGESRFPAQVRVHTRKLCEPLDEDAFRPILHHYDGPKFRLELSVPEALSLLDIFDEDLK